MTLLFFRYMKKSLNVNFPTESTIKSWVSKYPCLPGIQRVALEEIQRRIAKEPDTFTEASLAIDGMKLKIATEFLPAQDYIIGMSDLGGISTLEMNEEASEAIVVMLVGLRGHWKLPVAFIFVNRTSGDLIKDLVQRSLEETHRVGVRIRSCTFDGTAHNLAGLDKMGAVLQNSETLKPYFQHPSDENLSVLAYPDPPHMIKLGKKEFSFFIQMKLI